ncbi:MAG: carbohydrate ABC transporter substrate-binding protein [Tyzzerella sp.]|nr:carbohydrate ABC transporter substrate-binding protein [Tyzzerella sp.]
MKAKRIISIMMATTMVLGLAACGSVGTSSTDGDKKVIRVATWRKNDQKYYEEIERRFEEKYPEYDVQLEFNADEVSYEQNVNTDLVCRTAPDVFDLHASGQIQMYGDEGLILDQSDMEWTKNINENAKATCTWNGKSYAFPVNYNYFGFLYNKEIFDAEGLTVPKTPEELVTVVNKLKKAGYSGISYSGMTNGTKLVDAALIIELGTEKYNELLQGMDDGTVTDFLSYEGVETALKTVQYYTQSDIWYKGYKDTSYEPSLSLFAQKKAAIVFCGAYLYGEKDELMPGIDAGFFPIPTYSNSGVSYAEVGQCSCISATSKNIEGAKLWVEFLATPEISEYLCTSSRTMSTLESAVPTFEEAEMLLNSCTGYGLFKSFYTENAEYYDTELKDLKEGIFYYGDGYQEWVDVLNKRLKDADIINLK